MDALASAAGQSLWLAPTARAASAVRDALIDRGVEACLAPGVQTFDGLAKQIISGAKQKVRPISPVAERELLRRVIAAALEPPHPALSQRERVRSPQPRLAPGSGGSCAFRNGRARRRTCGRSGS